MTNIISIRVAAACNRSPWKILYAAMFLVASGFFTPAFSDCFFLDFACYGRERDAWQEGRTKLRGEIARVSSEREAENHRHAQRVDQLNQLLALIRNSTPMVSETYHMLDNLKLSLQGILLLADRGIAGDWAFQRMTQLQGYVGLACETIERQIGVQNFNIDTLTALKSTLPAEHAAQVETFLKSWKSEVEKFASVFLDLRPLCRHFNNVTMPSRTRGVPTTTAEVLAYIENVRALLKKERPSPRPRPGDPVISDVLNVPDLRSFPRTRTPDFPNMPNLFPRPQFVPDFHPRMQGGGK